MTQIERIERIERIRKMIKKFPKNPKNANDNYRLFLVKCAQLLELDTKLNEMEQREQPGDAESSKTFELQLESISDEVLKVIWH